MDLRYKDVQMRGEIMKLIDGGVCAAKGYKAAGVHCGIRKNQIKKLFI